MIFGKLTFQPHEKYILIAINMLVKINNIPFYGSNIIGHGGNNSFLVLAVNEDDNLFHWAQKLGMKIQVVSIKATVFF
jgi:fructose-1,6-bisphosphatase/sedoheptulose 1,7-bisphosphatase-like protein